MPGRARAAGDPGVSAGEETLQHPMQYFQWAQSLADFTPLAETAKAVCMLREQNPWRWVNSPSGALLQWQAVALEAVLMTAIGRHI